jgi:predicted phosphodiesterase
LRPGGATPRAGRVAALYDIHGNEPALRAVLAEVERELVDLVVVGGDVVPGPLPTETIETLRSLERPAVFIRGNTDRWVVEAFDGAEPGPAAVWTARRIDREQRDFLASFAERAVIEVNGPHPRNVGGRSSPASSSGSWCAATPIRSSTVRSTPGES